MDAQTIIAKRIARELRNGMLINLGIGIPTLVANYVPADVQVYFQSENGLIGTGRPPAEGMAHPTLTDAGGRPVTALPGASTFDSAISFGLIRGGHVDMTVLGRTSGRSARDAREVDDSWEDGSRHGRSHGSRDRCQARRGRHAAQREGKIEDREGVLVAAHIRTPYRSPCHRAGGHRLSRRQGDSH